ncbi:hypothetical protein EJB05_31997, partial [Eragrostis curvula]
MLTRCCCFVLAKTSCFIAKDKVHVSSRGTKFEQHHTDRFLRFLHDKVKPQVVHRDIRASNVLLDEEFGSHLMGSVESVEWQTIFEWATPLVQSHRYLELLDPLIQDLPDVGVIKVVDLVYSCTQHVPSVRPRMSHVVHQLQQLELKSAASEQLRSGTSTSATSPMLPLEDHLPVMQSFGTNIRGLVH